MLNAATPVGAATHSILKEKSETMYSNMTFLYLLYLR